jgi:hypothetical protein
MDEDNNRYRRGEAEWLKLYNEHIESKESMSSFCRSRLLPVSSYIKWYRKFSGKSAKVSPTSKFKKLISEANVEEVKLSSSKKIELELDIGSGIILRISK